MLPLGWLHKTFIAILVPIIKPPVGCQPALCSEINKQAKNRAPPAGQMPNWTKSLSGWQKKCHSISTHSKINMIFNLSVFAGILFWFVCLSLQLCKAVIWHRGAISWGLTFAAQGRRRRVFSSRRCLWFLHCQLVRWKPSHSLHWLLHEVKRCSAVAHRNTRPNTSLQMLLTLSRLILLKEIATAKVKIIKTALLLVIFFSSNVHFPKRNWIETFAFTLNTVNKFYLL